MLIETIDYQKGRIRIIDQTVLPLKLQYAALESLEEIETAVCSLKVRGAPAIGIAAAFGILLAIDEKIRILTDGEVQYVFDREEVFRAEVFPAISIHELETLVEQAAKALGSTRPTAVNLFWAIDRMLSAFHDGPRDPASVCRSMAEAAFRIRDEELEMELAIGKNGARYIRDGMRILTHCNAGGLATAGYGTALAIVYRAVEEGKTVTVYAGETRPLLQGSRLTSWELMKNGINVKVLCDSAAASLFSRGKVDCVLVGADRIARNGDTANKIGTLSLAILSKVYLKPFYVAAPVSTFDAGIESGSNIPIEERPPEEISVFNGRRLVPEEVGIYNPAFDVTPAEYISSIITEKGVIERPRNKNIASIINKVDTR